MGPELNNIIKTSPTLKTIQPSHSGKREKNDIIFATVQTSSHCASIELIGSLYFSTNHLGQRNKTLWLIKT